MKGKYNHRLVLSCATFAVVLEQIALCTQAIKKQRAYEATLARSIR